MASRDGGGEKTAMWNYKWAMDAFPVETIPDSAVERGEIQAKRIKERLALKQMSQKELAKNAGIKPQVMSRILSDDPKVRPKEVKIKRAILFAAILECTPHYLLGFTNKPGEKINRRGEVVEELMFGIPLSEIAFSECMKRCKDLDFVRCICEIVAKNTTENQLVERTKTMLIASGFCNPEKFEVNLPMAWQNDEKTFESKSDFKVDVNEAVKNLIIKTLRDPSVLHKKENKEKETDEKLGDRGSGEGDS